MISRIRLHIDWCDRNDMESAALYFEDNFDSLQQSGANQRDGTAQKLKAQRRGGCIFINPARPSAMAALKN
jgi:hypothetical protein